ncbi:chitin deacetylase 1-like [Paramacrobiotus metropolitanus]|uniref:chitin deacetylase 1-like n=1 Tax=Paramacrobiotus metropolitanus TaxID=2943436 RepID=UPI002445D3BB|nr:chitin deacetylase 1-like [Paramacrobiotus metropolitanus]
MSGTTKMVPLDVVKWFRMICCGFASFPVLIFGTTFRQSYDATFCIGQSNGLYADPSDCAAFYSCFSDKTFHFSCPPGLRFDFELQVCTWKAKCVTALGPQNKTTPSPVPHPEHAATAAAELVQCTSLDDVRCADGSTCIARTKVCDTVRDCPEGGTDEYGCDVKADQFASQPCKKENCVLPSCFCSADGTQIPNNLQMNQVPQMIVLAFLGAVNIQNYDLTRALFLPTRLNPNQCPVRGTFFVSHEYSDYSQIERLFRSGHEIALSTISRDRENQFWWTSVSSYKDWGMELQGQREILNNFAHIPLTEVRGAQAPSLHLGGNTQFAAMQDFGFEWDSSITVPSAGRPVWPYKLAYSVPHKCHQSGCPTRPYNLWEIPINQLVDAQGFGCSSLGSCRNDEFKSSDEVLQWLLKRFYRNYHDNRAPLVLLIDHNWMQDNFDALSRFIETVITKPEQDTFFVTYHQLVQWLQTPTTLDLMAEFTAWACDEEATPNVCEPIECDLPFVHGGSRRFRACMAACPASFPWKDNVDGRRSVDSSAKKYVETTAAQSTTTTAAP